MIKNLLLYPIVVGLMLFSMVACEEDKFNYEPSVRLTFSADTLSFDTIFTDLGSTTKVLKIYNPTENKLILSDISLCEGTYFNLNIDGYKGNSKQDVILYAKDSLLIFVQTEINANDEKTPFIIEDSISITCNTAKQKVVLQAYGQNAVRFKNKVIRQDTTLTADMPILIYDTLRVMPGVTLSVTEGTRLYFRKYAVCIVEGTLRAEGTVGNWVQFRGDRDDFMNTIPPLSYDLCSAQWGGIVFTKTSRNNSLYYTDVRNATFGIRVDSTSLDHVALKVETSMLRNASQNVLSAVHANVVVNNSLLYNAGGYVLSLEGGNHELNQNTIANYYSFSWGGREVPVVRYSNYHLSDNGEKSVFPFSAVMRNSIVYGGYNREVDYLFEGEDVTYTFSYCLLKMKLSSIDSHYENCIFDKDPAFVFSQLESEDVRHIYDFHLLSNSPAIGTANRLVAEQFKYDLDGVDRYASGIYDIGCYTFVAQ